MANPGPASSVVNHTQSLLSNQAIRLLAFVQGANVNAAGDIALPVLNSTVYSVSNVILVNASISLSVAAAGLFTAVAAGGTAIVASGTLAANTGSTVVSQRSVASTATSTVQNLYLNVATAQGAAATVDVYVYGYDFS